MDSQTIAMRSDNQDAVQSDNYAHTPPALDAGLHIQGGEARTGLKGSRYHTTENATANARQAKYDLYGKRVTCLNITVHSTV